MKLAKLRNKDKRQAYNINEMTNKVYALEACESTCHESTLKYEIEKNKDCVVVEKKK